MGLGLPDGGHLTHGYYVRTNFDLDFNLRGSRQGRSMAWAPRFHCGRGLEILLTFICHLTDSKEKNDGVLDLFPIISIRYRKGQQLDRL